MGAASGRALGDNHIAESKIDGTLYGQDLQRLRKRDAISLLHSMFGKEKCYRCCPMHYASERSTSETHPNPNPNRGGNVGNSR